MGTTLRAPTLGNTGLLLWNEEEASWQWRGGGSPGSCHRAPSFSRHYPPALWEPQDGDREDSTATGRSGWLGQTTAEGGNMEGLSEERPLRRGAGQSSTAPDCLLWDKRRPKFVPTAGCWDWQPEAYSEAYPEVDGCHLMWPKVLVATKGPEA